VSSVLFRCCSQLLAAALLCVSPFFCSVGEYQTLTECRDAIEKLSGAALDGKIVKLTPLVSVKSGVNFD
jgi:hypothetical protein